MPEPLRVLLLEDVPTDAELVERELRKTYPECVVHCVDEHDAFEAALESFSPHAVLSDHRLATFSGMDALRVAKVLKPDGAIHLRHRFAGRRNRGRMHQGGRLGLHPEGAPDAARRRRHRRARSQAHPR